MLELNQSCGRKFKYDFGGLLIAIVYVTGGFMRVCAECIDVWMCRCGNMCLCICIRAHIPLCGYVCILCVVCLCLDSICMYLYVFCAYFCMCVYVCVCM